MSFRKRNTIINARKHTSTAASEVPGNEKTKPGVRPSPLDGRPTISTGTASLDGILAGHAGLPLGTSVLVEEDGTTDFSGILLKYYAAEGLVQGHIVHALALHQGWTSELPGLSFGASSSRKIKSAESEKMKIAWRYEALAAVSGSRDTPSTQNDISNYPKFCYPFDLKKRLAKESVTGEIFFTETASSLMLPLDNPTPASSPFDAFLLTLNQKLANSASDTIHRVVIPSLLSPMLYSPSLCHPSIVLQFLHSLRATLRKYSDRLTAMITFPISIFPRSSGLTRWIEHLCDGVMEITPIRGPITTRKPDEQKEDQMQGLFKVHTLPIFHERGGGGSEGNSAREILSFTLSASKGLFVKPYALPPMEEEEKIVSAEKKQGLDF